MIKNNVEICQSGFRTNHNIETVLLLICHRLSLLWELLIPASQSMPGIDDLGGCLGRPLLEGHQIPTIIFFSLIFLNFGNSLTHHSLSRKIKKEYFKDINIKVQKFDAIITLLSEAHSLLVGGGGLPLFFKISRRKRQQNKPSETTLR